MANETKFEIKGNYLIAVNVTTRKEYFRENPEKIKYTRSENDHFVFYFNIETGNNPTVVKSYILGNGRASFIFSDSLDDSDNPFADADVFDIWLSTRTGGKQNEVTTVAWGDITGNITNQTDLITKLNTKIDIEGNVSDLVNDAGYLTDNYEERWDLFTPSVSNAWSTQVLTGSPVNRIVSILIDSNTNNRTVGVRQVGSTLNRTVRIDTDSAITFNVKTNALGEIQYFSDGTAGVLFYVQSYNN